MTSESAPVTDPDGWDATLAGAFAVLLGAESVVGPGAEYRV